MWAKKIFFDPLFRLLLSGSLFTAVFVWIAIFQFEVESEVIRVFFWLSFLFVGSMIVVGLILAPLMALTRKKRSHFFDEKADDEDP